MVVGEGRRVGVGGATGDDAEGRKLWLYFCFVFVRKFEKLEGES